MNRRVPVPYQSIENVTSFEHFKLGLDAHSSVRLVNHRFDEDTVVENVFAPGLYISMLGQCQCQALSDGCIQKQEFNHQYVAAIVEEQSISQIQFAKHSMWQTFSIMLPIQVLNRNSVVTALRNKVPHGLPNIRFSELGPVPSDILRCCESVWDCNFDGFERELFIKAKAQEVLALFLHKHREQSNSQVTDRMAQLNNTLSHIQTHLDQDWSLAAVANLAGSNRTYIKQDIKQLVGISFRDWLKKVRLEAALEQLSGSESIIHISHNIGFKSQAHFATWFKGEMKVTPSEYRQSLVMQRIA